MMALNFYPIIRGYNNASMKDSSVRSGGLYYEDAELFDLIHQSHQRIIASKLRATTIYNLKESMIDLRDLQTFLTHVSSNLYNLHQMYSNEDVSIFIAEGISYYMSQMHETDARMLQKQTPLILREGMNIESILDATQTLIKCVDNMCAINARVILSALKR